ncbi:unnamed protein product [Rhizophagus irregularis]|nr:unnamed protein product [Rhizophagus irregularis]
MFIRDFALSGNRCWEKVTSGKWMSGIDNFKLIPEKLIEGRNGQGNLDYAIECRSTGRVLGVIEVKKGDFMKGFAQASVQMESILTRKRKLMKSIMSRM